MKKPKSATIEVQIYSPDIKGLEFETLRNQAELNRGADFLEAESYAWRSQIVIPASRN